MKHYHLYRSILPPFKRHKYLREGNWYDYLGQLIAQMDTNSIPEKCRWPSDLDHAIPPFSFPLRGSICNTELTIGILRLDYTEPAFHEKKLNELLNPHGISVTLKDRLPRQE